MHSTVIDQMPTFLNERFTVCNATGDPFAPGGGLGGSALLRELPKPQWINADVRTFDFSILGGYLTPKMFVARSFSVLFFTALHFPQMHIAVPAVRAFAGSQNGTSRHDMPHCRCRRAFRLHCITRLIRPLFQLFP